MKGDELTELLTGSQALAVSDSDVGAGRGRNPAAGRDTEELQDGAIKGGLSLKGIAERIGQYAAPSTLDSLGAINLRNEQEGGRHGSKAIIVLRASQATPFGVGHPMHLLLWPQSGGEHT